MFYQSSVSNVLAQPASYPTPAKTPNQLFYLQRTHNTNTIVYDLNLINGQLDTDDPVHVYWIRYQENAQKEELSFIQRNFAYGLNSEKISDTEFEMSLVAYKKFKMYLKPGTDGQYRMFTSINKKQSILTRVYLQMKEGGSIWSPNIEYVDLTGVDVATGQVVQERIKI